MTDDTFDELQKAAPPEVESEEEFDDNDYTPAFIKKLLDFPELLPREIREDFVHVFEAFEYTHGGSAKTTFEYILVSEATKLTLNLQNLDRVEGAILINHQRPAVESLFRKTHEGAAIRNAEGAIHAEAALNATKYFADPAFKAKSDKAFEAAGYAPEALEGEAYFRALPSLVLIHRQKASDRKALFGILKDLELRYASRHPEKTMVVNKPSARSAKPKVG